MPLDPEDMLRSFEAQVDGRTQRALQLSAELAAAEVTARSPGGEVTVRINSAGGLVDLEFHAGAESVTRAELARLVLAASRRAQARLADRMGELVSSVYGPGSSTAAFITDAYAGRYPAPDDTDEETR